MIENTTPNPTPNLLNPTINIEQNQPDGSEFLIHKKEENPEPQILLHKITYEKPGFRKRWGSFIDFLRYGSEMENKRHLRGQHDVQDKLEIIEKSPVLNITEENTDPQNTPPKLLLFFDNELVKNHITGQKNENVARKNNSVLAHQKTTYKVDNIYSHTTIDEITRQRQEDFWHDKEVKTYALAGTTLALGITSLLIMPTIIALMVAGVAVKILLHLSKRANEATQEVHAWRDTVEENYRLRQEAGMEHLYDPEGDYPIDPKLIGKIFDPQDDAWQIWLDKWKTFSNQINELLIDQEFSMKTVDQFFENNPFNSYDQIASSIKPNPKNHDNYKKLNAKYIQLQRAYEMITYGSDENSKDLFNVNREEQEKISELKKGWTDRVDNAARQLIGIEPNNIDKEKLEEHNNWCEKKEKVEAIKKHYLEQADIAFEPRKTKFDPWHSSREKSIEASAKNTLSDLLKPIQSWWNLVNLLNQNSVAQELWKIDSVEIGENLKNDQPIELPQLPKPLPFELVMQSPDKKTLEEKKLHPELTKAFIKLF